MGHTVWSNKTYKDITAGYSTMSRDQIFTSNAKRRTHEKMDPKNVAFVETRDSEPHPQTFGVAVFLDVTGSMRKIPEILVREKLGTLMSTLIKHDIHDAQILFGAIGDHYSDRAPLQVGQFESGTDELDQWLSRIYLEGNGGSQHMESYLLAWLFAARHTRLDCLEKRKQKGILITIGDEATHPKVETEALNKILGGQNEDLYADSLLEEAQEMYHVFHIHAEQGAYPFSGVTGGKVVDDWRDKLTQNLIIMDDYNEIAEIIATTVALTYGIDIDHVVRHFNDKTASNIKKAFKNVRVRA